MPKYTNGYEVVYLPSHPRAHGDGYVYEHILIVEQKLNRPLRPKEVVHHKDENKENNSPENLIVFATNTDHSTYHKGGTLEKVEDYYISRPTEKMAKSAMTTGITVATFKKKYPEHIYLLKRCKVCGAECLEDYCSNKCSNISQRRANRPSKEELDVLIHTVSFVKIGEKYGVSDNAIRKWCKSYNLPYRVKDLRE